MTLIALSLPANEDFSTAQIDSPLNPPVNYDSTEMPHLELRDPIDLYFTLLTSQVPQTKLTVFIDYHFSLFVVVNVNFS